MISNLLHLVGLRPRVYYTLTNFRGGGGGASVSEMLHDLGWQSLDGRRQDQRLVLFYKIINGLASVETEDIPTPADSRMLIYVSSIGF